MLQCGRHTGWGCLTWPRRDAVGGLHLALRKDLLKSAGLRLRLGQAVAEVRSCALTPVAEVHGIHCAAHVRNVLLTLWGVLRWLLRLHSMAMFSVDRHQPAGKTFNALPGKACPEACVGRPFSVHSQYASCVSRSSHLVITCSTKISRLGLDVYD